MLWPPTLQPFRAEEAPSLSRDSDGAKRRKQREKRWKRGFWSLEEEQKPTNRQKEAKQGEQAKRTGQTAALISLAGS